jgi:hypothetical protein
MFIPEYAKDFNITKDVSMASFLGIDSEVEHCNGPMKLNLDTYIQDALDEHKTPIKTSRKSKKVPLQRGFVPEHVSMMIDIDCPETPDPREQKLLRSVVAKLQFAASWVQCDVSYQASHLARLSDVQPAGPSHWGIWKETRASSLHTGEGTGKLDAFTDSDWGNRWVSRGHLIIPSSLSKTKQRICRT